MFSKIVITYSYWYLFAAVVVALSFAALLYYRNRRNQLSAMLTIILFLFRTTVVFLLLVLLLSPYVKRKTKYVEKPIVIMGMDNSQSMVMGKDSAFNRHDLLKQWSLLKKELAEKYQLETYLFGSDVKNADDPDYQDVLSDYSQFIRYIGEKYKGMNYGAVILAGDGIYNAGIEPAYAASELAVPFYTIALGDTSSFSDAKISDVRYNSLVYKGDSFPLEVNISAEKMKSTRAELIISANGKVRQRNQFEITKEHFNIAYLFHLKAEETGKQHINIRLNVQEEELNKDNNVTDIFIDVLENAQKILILADGPHPDISAIKQALEASTNYETTVKYMKDGRNPDVNDYDLVILHQVPSVSHPSDMLIKQLAAKEIPVLFILGKQSSLPRFNKAFKGVKILSSIGKSENAQADLNPLFTLFTYDQQYSDDLEELPPLIVPMGNYIVADNASVFANQKINNISVDFPLVVFYDNLQTKGGAILGEGLWMWRMHNFLNNGTFDAFDSFINKCIQYLTTQKDKRFFRINSKNEFANTEEIVLKAELYNESYEPVNTSEVSLILTDEKSRQFNYLFSPEKSTYVLHLQKLQPGVYRYIAAARSGEKKYTATGEFIVHGQSFESRKLKADHHELFRIGEKTNGRMLYPDQMNVLPEVLAESNSLKKRTYIEEKMDGLNSMTAMLMLILLMISAEWFLRKYFGSY